MLEFRRDAGFDGRDARSTISKTDLLNGPARVFGNQGFWIMHRFFQHRQGGFAANISQRHTNIPEQSAPFRPQHWRAGEF